MSSRIGLAIFPTVLMTACRVSDSDAKDINFGWPSGEGWSSQPFKAAMEKGFLKKKA